MIALWVGLLVFGIGGASLCSRRAVDSALRITDALKVSPALVGVTVMAIGTDLPEIANSVISSASGHGDINVGDSMGSVVTQVTLVLGLLCLGTGGITADRNFVISVGVAAFFASVTVWILVRDGRLSHVDGLVLLVLWLAGTMLLGQGELSPRQVVDGTNGAVAADVGRTLLWLGLVGLFAIVVVQSFLRISDAFGVPEFLGSFLALSIGTSLPELVVDWTAIRRGASAMAIGDVFGSSFVDATLSVGIGPMIFGSELSDDVVGGVALAAIGVLVATILVARSERRGRTLGIGLIGVYAAVQTMAALLGS